jgi:hypothetical protein
MATKVHTTTDGEICRPDMERMADILGFERGFLPPELIRSQALCRTLTKAVKRIDKEGHINLWASDELQLETTRAFARNSRELSKPVLRREAPAGTLVLRDSSCGTRKDFYWSVDIEFYPTAIVEDPRLVADVCQPVNGFLINHALDIALNRELWDLVDEEYSGPGFALVDEGDEFNVGAIIRVSGDLNEVLDSEDVASGLNAVFADDQFDDLVSYVVEHTKMIHRNLRK